MASFISSTSTTLPTHTPSLNPKFIQTSFSSLSLSPNSSNPRKKNHHLFSCYAAKQQQSSGQPVKKRQSSSSSSTNNSSKKKAVKKNSKNGGSSGGFNKGFGGIEDEGEDDGDGDGEVMSSSSKVRYQPLPLPKPPAGFIVDDQGRVVAVSDRRIATIVSDDEVESILPTASFALAKIHMHLVYSGFCYTARGGFCYTEDDIFECRSDDGQDLDGLPTEGVEITCFQLDGSHYMIYTPSDPLLFVAVKDDNGKLRIADDEVLEDPATISAIDEETEFNALVVRHFPSNEEEAALMESLMGKR
ncbi:hypothetical protein OSB04_029637 [Centaurea solstitialis]|uniref:Uncharacterized protein n=1 Tax=Centaurea solstitialis TaxID=347529 RepID=A0AA38S786_9ASTR|nr:hypothetical protein OSB04_029637 [Centaurea solstitialis]